MDWKACRDVVRRLSVPASSPAIMHACTCGPSHCGNQPMLMPAWLHQQATSCKLTANASGTKCCIHLTCACVWPPSPHQAAALSEFRADWATAVRSYEAAYREIAKAVPSPNIQLQRFFELAAVAELLHLKVRAALPVQHWGVGGQSQAVLGSSRRGVLFNRHTSSRSCIHCSILKHTCCTYLSWEQAFACLLAWHNDRHASRSSCQAAVHMWMCLWQSPCSHV